MISSQSQWGGWLVDIQHKQCLESCFVLLAFFELILLVTVKYIIITSSLNWRSAVLTDARNILEKIGAFSGVNGSKYIYSTGEISRLVVSSASQKNVENCFIACLPSYS